MENIPVYYIEHILTTNLLINDSKLDIYMVKQKGSTFHFKNRQLTMNYRKFVMEKNYLH
jgi:hypothetical protein